MSRLRYNGLVATLAGSGLTNSGTTVTFAAGLTYNGGTNVPTITGSDYIPLSILDSDGILSELVYLTAYTAGATTGTITRAQESTVGVAHSAGVQVLNAPTVLDLTPAVSGAYAYPIDDPANWSADLGFDQEFSAGTFTTPVTTLPTGWSWTNQGGATYSESLGVGLLTAPANSGESLRTIVRSLSGAPATWDLYAKIEYGWDARGNYAEGGLVFRDSAGAACMMLGSYLGADYASRAVIKWTSNSALAFPFLGNQLYSPYKYWRIRKNSATSYDYFASTDGKSWNPFLLAHNPAFTPDQIGLALNRNNGSLAIDLGISWMRLR